MPQIKREKTYPLADRALSERRYHKHFKQRAKLTGEKRAPKRGEWYLSGAIPAAYQAPNDLSTEYHIVELVYVEDSKNAPVIVRVKEGLVQEIEAPEGVVVIVRDYDTDSIPDDELSRDNFGTHSQTIWT
jgi:hypothetical protein